MSAHTAGPWVLFTDNGSPLAVLPAGRLGTVAEFARGPGQTPSDTDARLIAASPDLLAALEGLTRAREGQPGFRDAFQAAVDAIAKARGTK